MKYTILLQETDFDDENLTDYPKISSSLETPKEWTYVMRRSMQVQRIALLLSFLTDIAFHRNVVFRK